jgi:hypothetical protein
VEHDAHLLILHYPPATQVLLAEWRALAAAASARRVEAMRRMHHGGGGGAGIGLGIGIGLQRAFTAWHRTTPRRRDVSAAVARLSRKIRLRYDMSASPSERRCELGLGEICTPSPP